MGAATYSLSDIKTRLDAILDRYMRAQLRGDFLEALLAVHTALEDAFEAILVNRGEDISNLSFFDKVGRIFSPPLTEQFAELNRKRREAAHPRWPIEDSEFVNTAAGLVGLALQSWPGLFGTAPPFVEHPSLRQPADLARAPREKKTIIQQLKAHLEKPRRTPPWQELGIRWRALIFGFLLLLPMPLLAGFGQWLWRERPIAWYWLLVPAALLLALAFFALRNLWRFLRSTGVVRLFAGLCVGLVLTTLVLTPFAGRGLEWDARAGAALTRVLGFTGHATAGYVSALFATGETLASGLFPPPAPTLAPEETPALPTYTAGTATPRSGPTTVTGTPGLSGTGTITVGTRVIVTTAGARLRARVAPGLESDIQTQFENSTELVVVDGPIGRDGLVWWEVEGEDGRGWSIADCLVPVVPGKKTED